MLILVSFDSIWTALPNGKDHVNPLRFGRVMAKMATPNFGIILQPITRLIINESGRSLYHSIEQLESCRMVPNFMPFPSYPDELWSKKCKNSRNYVANWVLSETFTSLPSTHPIIISSSSLASQGSRALSQGKNQWRWGWLGKRTRAAATTTSSSSSPPQSRPFLLVGEEAA